MRFIERFESLYIPEPNTGCWLWTGEVGKTGYGILRIGTRPYDAHRLSYFIHNGSIPEGIYVCHECSVKSCVNPTHLWLGTNATNMKDASLKGALSRTHAKGTKLSDQDVKEIITIYGTGEYSQRAIASKYGVVQQTISEIITGQKHNNLTNILPIDRHIDKILPRPNSKLLDSFHASYTKNENGCWIWNGETSRGYGLLRMGKTIISAHRLSYELFNDEIPLNMDICHTCDQPSCVASDHLWVGTTKENMQDAVKKGRMARGSKSGASKMNETQVIEMIDLYKTGDYSTYKLGASYGLDPSTVFDIVNGNTWKHLNVDRSYIRRKKKSR